MMFENRKEGVGWFPDCHSHKEHSSSAARIYLLARREHPSLHAAGFFTPKLAAAAMCRNFGAATAPNDAEVPIRWALWLGRHVPEPTSLTRWREQETVTVLNQQPSCCRRGELARWVMPQSKAVCNHCPRRQRHLRRLRARGFGNSNRSEGSRAGLLFGLRQSGSDHFPIWKG